MKPDRREIDINAADKGEYLKFTGPARLDKALHTLEGLLRGVAADGEITTAELKSVRQWIEQHRPIVNRHPFNEIIHFLDDVLADGVVDAEEAKDVLWLCDQLSTSNEYFAAVTSDLQRLQGLMAGIAADGKITVDELNMLSDWIDEHEGLKGFWPYDELETVILEVLRDKKIDAEEHSMLIALFNEFLSYGTHKSAAIPLDEMTEKLGGFCAVCPEITFQAKKFCFTGRSKRASRKELANKVEKFGGEFIPSVRNDLNYLVIGDGGNESWAFACYGRKVEAAITLRKRGLPIVIVHENDFWDAVADIEG